MSERSRVLVVSKYRVSAEALRTSLSLLQPEYLVETAVCCDTQPSDFDPEVVVVLCLGGCPAGPHAITSIYPRAKVLVIARSPSLSEQAAWVEAGIAGVLDEADDACDVEQVGAALAAVRSGELWVPRELLLHMLRNDDEAEPPHREFGLTPRETKVLSLLHLGMSNGDIGGLFHISEKTVKAHLTSLYRKLGVENRMQAVFRTRDLRCAECGGSVEARADGERASSVRRAS